MAARKRTPKEEPEEELYYLAEEEDFESEMPASIETEVEVDAIEFEDNEDPKAAPVYRVTFHAELPEHIAQHLFAHHVQEGRITVEFQPADPALRRRGTLIGR